MVSSVCQPPPYNNHSRIRKADSQLNRVADEGRFYITIVVRRTEPLAIKRTAPLHSEGLATIFGSVSKNDDVWHSTSPSVCRVSYGWGSPPTSLGRCGSMPLLVANVSASFWVVILPIDTYGKDSEPWREMLHFPCVYWQYFKKSPLAIRYVTLRANNGWYSSGLSEVERWGICWNPCSATLRFRLIIRYTLVWWGFY